MTAVIFDPDAKAEFLSAVRYYISNNNALIRYER